ncbi:hypothetical protein ACWEO1_11925 [Kitasatospora cineracea]|uniref:hypothetical protein n=1 Tax=Kitasatospora sp. NRRL B-11411 TaxID=1463822 RepID=UPI0004C2BA6E|nr:hypothetical protein [Kitasatospora sp. NRRL B-11411]
MARARYCLALMVVGWAGSWVALRSEENVQGVLKHCLDSPGLPWYALLLAWAGPVLSLAASGWAVRLALRTLRETSRPISAGRGLLFVALPAALLIGVFQGVVLEDGQTYRGAQRSPCVGAAAVLR